MFLIAERIAVVSGEWEADSVQDAIGSFEEELEKTLAASEVLPTEKPESGTASPVEEIA